jgi:hydrogenase maturation protein HypF
MLRSNTACVATSSTGRVFDAFSALLGLAGENRYEGYAPALLESTAAGGEVEARDLFILAGDEIDLGPLVRWVVDRLPAHRAPARSAVAATVHEQIARALAAAALRASQQLAIGTVALSGGVFINELLATQLESRLRDNGLRVLRHERTPPNDGGIALGQAYVASHIAAAGPVPFEMSSRRDGAGSGLTQEVP